MSNGNTMNKRTSRPLPVSHLQVFSNPRKAGEGTFRHHGSTVSIRSQLNCSTSHVSIEQASMWRRSALKWNMPVTALMIPTGRSWWREWSVNWRILGLRGRGRRDFSRRWLRRRRRDKARWPIGGIGPVKIASRVFILRDRMIRFDDFRKGSCSDILHCPYSQPHLSLRCSVAS